MSDQKGYSTTWGNGERRATGNGISLGDITRLQSNNEDQQFDIDAITSAAPSVHGSNNTIELAVEILRRSNNMRMNERTRLLLTPGLVRGIYAAEEAHMSFTRRAADFLGIRRQSVGRGQVREDAFNQVRNVYGREFSQYLRVLRIRASGNFREDIQNEAIHDFIVAGYIAFHIWWNYTNHPSRDPEDTLRFAIGLYTGARPMLNRAGDTFNHNNEIPIGTPIMRFSDIAGILEQGNSDERRLLSYINMVYDSR